jgi:hypothetical protein
LSGVRREHGALVAFFLAILAVLGAPARAHAGDRPPPVNGGTPWYERIHIRGYTQVRYGSIAASNRELKSAQGDRFIGRAPGFSIRRARLILFGDIGEHFAFYLQPDFGSAVDESLHFGQLRDWWGEVFLDRRMNFRIRVGQQKVPFGFELMQSSQNRLALDRTDAMNSAFVNERDLGAFFMFETEKARKLFRDLVDEGHKGSGDYGLTSVGISNGQPLNTRERNANKHFFARVTYPFDVGSQTLELSGGGYSGLFVPTRTEDVGGRREVRDMRAHATFVLYPKPFGIQAEYNAGVGPERVGSQVLERPLDGGYVVASYRIDTDRFGTFFPYARVHRYDGGKKFEQNAPRHEIRELNAGLEWQPIKPLEIVTELMASDRAVDGARQTGRLVRLQVQLNY